ncbi:MAG TPA: NAD(P)-dependent oxidoreductase [Clostridia bacterium]|nr:NAD(P)-dependent oxidoreductase [Clostridia bacterium]
MKMIVAFIGIGVMGLSMARNLMKNGHELRVYTRTASKAQPLVDEGASQFDNIRDCVQGAQAVITIVGYPKDVEEVYLGKGGILDSAEPGALVIDMTTTSPVLWQRIARMARERGLRPLDAPVSGGDVGARDAKLAIMAGGHQEDFEAARPLFECMGKTIILEGGDGAGQHTKMANQIAIAGAIAGVAEAVRYGEAAGLDLTRMLDTISTGAAGSFQMNNNGRKMVSGDMAPGFFIKHFIKDLGIAREEGKQRGLKLPFLKKALGLYKELEEAGKGELGTQALIERYRD